MLLVLAALAMPSVADPGELIGAAERDGEAWLMAAVAFFLASIGLTMGLPAILTMFPGRLQSACLAGVWLWAVGTIGTAAVAAMLILFRATVRTGVLTDDAVAEMSRDHALVALLLAVVGAFLLGELVVALLLLRSRVAPRWVPIVLLVHVVLAPINHLAPIGVQGLPSLLLGVGLMGVAVRATELWAGTRGPAPS